MVVRKLLVDTSVKVIVHQIYHCSLKIVSKLNSDCRGIFVLNRFKQPNSLLN